MNTKLNFKEKMAQLQLTEGEQSQELALPQKKNKARYKELIQQKKKASIDVEYLKKGSERRNHVFAFADNYRPVTAKECRNFYKKNPEEFKKEKDEALMFGLICSAPALGLMLLGLKNGVGDLEKALFAISMCGIGIFPAIVAVLGLGTWACMAWTGVENWKANQDSFLMVFANDKNLKKLWFKKSDKPMVLAQKSYKKKEKDVQRINAYHETQRWLHQWSGGDVKQLRSVEWKTLCGIAEKYEKYLTPVNSNQEFTDSVD